MGTWVLGIYRPGLRAGTEGAQAGFLRTLPGDLRLHGSQSFGGSFSQGKTRAGYSGGRIYRAAQRRRL